MKLRTTRVVVAVVLFAGCLPFTGCQSPEERAMDRMERQMDRQIKMQAKMMKQMEKSMEEAEREMDSVD